ncbi:MAG TPA: GntR family transcriptional regulator [Pseudonocardia sp.]|jgi:DNA-binding GntR family transcriptional regulator
MPGSAPVGSTPPTISVVERVTNDIRSWILSGRLEPGEEFSLRRIAAWLGVSFIPVREALRSLEAEGLLVTRRGRSAVVASLDAEELRAVLRLRRLFEPDLAVRSHACMPPAEVDRLEADQRAWAEWGGPPDERYERYHQFYRETLRPAATAWDLRIAERLLRATERYFRIGFGRIGPDAEGIVLDGQRQLVAGYRQCDPGPVRAASLAYLERIEYIAGHSVEPWLGPEVNPAGTDRHDRASDRG